MANRNCPVCGKVIEEPLVPLWSQMGHDEGLRADSEVGFCSAECARLAYRVWHDLK